MANVLQRPGGCKRPHTYSDQDKEDIYVIAFDLGDFNGRTAYRKLVRTARSQAVQSRGCH